MKKELKSLKPTKAPAPFDEIIAIDIETGSNGELLDIGCKTEKQYQTFDNWKDFFEYLLPMKGNFRIIAHNGFGFDFITFNQWFLRNFKKYKIKDDDVTYLSSESLIIAMILKREKSQFMFLDTMRFFPATSLQSLSESFLGESKRDVPEKYISQMEVYKAKFPRKYYAYLKQDCELLFKIYKSFRQEINDFVPVGEIGMSSGSTAMKTFRRWLGVNRSSSMIFSAPVNYLKVTDYAYRGGLALYIGDGTHDNHLYEGVNHYDVVSMYPSVMRVVPCPTSPMVYMENISLKKISEQFGRVWPGWYFAEFTQTAGRVPILYSLDSENPVWSGQGVLSHYEIEFLMKFGKVKIRDGIVFDQFANLFDRFLSQLIAKRLDAKSAGLSAKAYALKILANSLYGKFGQKHTKEIIAITSDRDWYDSFLAARLRASDDSGVTEYAYSKDLVLYGVESESTAFSNRFVGALITSLARLKLGMLYNTYPTIYCDTDSIFTQAEMSEKFLGKGLGEWERDELSPSPMICLGKKSYQYGEEIKFKGIPRKSINADNIERIRQGKTFEAVYRSPTAWKTAMKYDEQSPNKFTEKKRRVKRGQSFAELGILKTERKFFDESVTLDFLNSFLR